MDVIESRLQAVESQLVLVLQSLSLILHKESHIMFSVQDLTDEIAKAAATTAAERTEVQAALAAQEVKINELKAQIAAIGAPGSMVTQEQLDALVVAVQAVSAATADIYVPPMPAGAAGTGLPPAPTEPASAPTEPAPTESAPTAPTPQ